MEWKQVEYSKNQIIKAGKTVRQEDCSVLDYVEAIQIIDNWRASHAYPLHIISMNLRRTAKKHKGIIVAERLKRLDSITNKLKRETSMSLWTMQDLGGCRVIVKQYGTKEDYYKAIDKVYDFADKYENSRKRHKLVKTYDYIKNPKESGYRCLHRVYEFHSDSKDTYNRNILIEVQYRTELQHLWATAVETMGLFKNENIKAGCGSEDIKRYFALISSVFALYERQEIVPNTSNDIMELAKEIQVIESQYKYLDFLSGVKVAVRYQDKKKFKRGYYLLQLDYKKSMLTIKHYNVSQIDEANKMYALAENSKNNNKLINAVLVRTSSFNSLKSAYPNYFADITNFVITVQTVLDAIKDL